jgi:hypothetical protein
MTSDLNIHSNNKNMKEATYKSQTDVIGYKALERKLSVSASPCPQSPHPRFTLDFVRSLRPIVRRLEANYKCCHQLQEVADYYFNWYTAAKKAYPDPKVPAIYHDFLAERKTWTHFCKSSYWQKD